MFKYYIINGVRKEVNDTKRIKYKKLKKERIKEINQIKLLYFLFHLS